MGVAWRAVKNNQVDSRDRGTGSTMHDERVLMLERGRWERRLMRETAIMWPWCVNAGWTDANGEYLHSWESQPRLRRGDPRSVDMRSEISVDLPARRMLCVAAGTNQSTLFLLECINYPISRVQDIPMGMIDVLLTLCRRIRSNPGYCTVYALVPLPDKLNCVSINLCGRGSWTEGGDNNTLVQPGIRRDRGSQAVSH